MSEVIAFPKPPDEPPERIIWVCSCGCCTYYLSPDHRAECANCGLRVSPEGSSQWQDVDEPPVPPDVPRPTIVRPVIDMDDPEYNLLSTLQHANRDKSAVVLVIQNDGDLHYWRGDTFETPEQVKWLKGRFKRALENVLSGKAAK